MTQKAMHVRFFSEEKTFATALGSVRLALYNNILRKIILTCVCFVVMGKASCESNLKKTAYPWHTLELPLYFPRQVFQGRPPPRSIVMGYVCWSAKTRGTCSAYFFYIPPEPPPSSIVA